MFLIKSSTANLTNTVLGTGMLSMPYTFATLGIAQGLVLITFTAILGGFGLSLLTQAAQTLKSRSVSFNALAKVSYPAVATVMDVSIALNCFGVSVSYLVVGIPSQCFHIF